MVAGKGPTHRTGDCFMSDNHVSQYQPTTVQRRFQVESSPLLTKARPGSQRHPPQDRQGDA